MVKDSTTSTDEEVNTAAEGSSLIFNIDATVDGERVELVGMVLQLGQFVLNLDSQFSCWSKNNSLNSSLSQHVVLSEVFCNGQAKGQCLATSR